MDLLPSYLCSSQVHPPAKITMQPQAITHNNPIAQQQNLNLQIQKHLHNICKTTQQAVHLSFQAPTVNSFEENSLYSTGFHIYTYRGGESFVF
jgi:hypothetical protein